MYLQLRHLTDPSADKAVVVKGPKFVIGRAVDCDLQLTDTRVSRHHCELSECGQITKVRDLGSANGTYLNEDLLRGEQVIRGGDKLTLGTVLLEVLDFPEVPHVNTESTQLASRTRRSRRDPCIVYLPWP